MATEDALSEAIGKRLLTSHQLHPDLLLRRNGVGYLRSRAQSWCELAQVQPLVMFADLDRTTCAPRLIEEWFGARTRPGNLVVRVAVREIESWVLADHDGVGQLFGRWCLSRLPLDPDRLQDPKEHLLQLAKRAPRAIRDDIVASLGSVSRQAVGYNARLGQFVANLWSPERASVRSDSLRRANVRLKELAVRLSALEPS